MDTLTITPNIRTQFPQGSITFTILQSISWQKEEMLDPSNTTYECTRVRGNVIVAYNPGAANFRANANPSAVPVSGFGAAGVAGGIAAATPIFPATTDAAIRRFLEQPRFQITVKSNGVTWLQSPGFGPNGIMASDVRGGPFMKADSIEYVQGERLWKIVLQIETYINESPKVAGASFPPLILSNRWYAIDDTNWQHLRTRIYQGICTVRGDVLQGQSFVANSRPYIDYFRNQFACFTVPVGMQRELIKVQVTPDGNSAHYTVVDEEQLFNKGSNNPAVRIEIKDTNWITLSERNNVAAQALGLGLGGVLWGQGIGFDLARAFFLGPMASRGGGGGGTKEAAALLSRHRKNIFVRVHGNALTNRQLLMQYAIAMASARMGLPAIFDTTLNEWRVSGDTNNCVEVEYTSQWGPEFAQSIFGDAGGSLLVLADGLLYGTNLINAGARAFQNSVGQSPNTTVSVPGVPGLPGVVGGIASGALTYTQARRIANPPFPADSGTRGTSATGQFPNNALRCLVTQALEQFDQVPASPTALPV